MNDNFFYIDSITNIISGNHRFSKLKQQDHFLKWELKPLPINCKDSLNYEISLDCDYTSKFMDYKRYLDSWIVNCYAQLNIIKKEKDQSLLNIQIINVLFPDFESLLFTVLPYYIIDRQQLIEPLESTDINILSYLKAAIILLATELFKMYTNNVNQLRKNPAYEFYQATLKSQLIMLPLNLKDFLKFYFKQDIDDISNMIIKLNNKPIITFKNPIKTKKSNHHQYNSFKINEQVINVFKKFFCDMNKELEIVDIKDGKRTLEIFCSSNLKNLPLKGAVRLTCHTKLFVYFIDCLSSVYYVNSNHERIKLFEQMKDQVFNNQDLFMTRISSINRPGVVLNSKIIQNVRNQIKISSLTENIQLLDRLMAKYFQTVN